jgi:hypothetical protein
MEVTSATSHVEENAGIITWRPIPRRTEITRIIARGTIRTKKEEEEEETKGKIKREKKAEEKTLRIGRRGKQTRNCGKVYALAGATTQQQETAVHRVHNRTL